MGGKLKTECEDI